VGVHTAEERRRRLLAGVANEIVFAPRMMVDECRHVVDVPSYEYKWSRSALGLD